jgi:hypothetical protein
MAYRTPGGSNNDSIDDLDESGGDFMELDTPLPRGTGRSRVATNLNSTKSSRGKNTSSSASSSSSSSSSFSSSSASSFSSFKEPSAPSTNNSTFQLGQPPLVPPKAKGAARKNTTLSSSTTSSTSSSNMNNSANTTSSTLVPSLDALRRQAHVALYEQASPVSAIFYADSLVTLSKNNTSDVRLLAQAYVNNNEHRRAVHLLEHTGCLQLNNNNSILNVQNILLGGQCYAKCTM